MVEIPSGIITVSICSDLWSKRSLWTWNCEACNQVTAAAAAQSLQSCPTLCDPRDGSPRGSPIPGILQARTLEWVAISFSRAWKGKVEVKSLSPVRLLATPWTAVYQAPLSMGFSRQEYWSGMPLPSPNQVTGICFIRCFWGGAHKCFLTDPMCCKCLPLPVLDHNDHSLLEAFHFDVMDPAISQWFLWSC